MTEKEILIGIAERLHRLIKEFTTDNEIVISSDHDITIRFDDLGNVIDFDTRT